MYVLFVYTGTVFEFSYVLFVDTNIVVSNALNKKKKRRRKRYFKHVYGKIIDSIAKLLFNTHITKTMVYVIIMYFSFLKNRLIGVDVVLYW